MLGSAREIALIPLTKIKLYGDEVRAQRWKELGWRAYVPLGIVHVEEGCGLSSTDILKGGKKVGAEQPGEEESGRNGARQLSGREILIDIFRFKK